MQSISLSLADLMNSRQKPEHRQMPLPEAQIAFLTEHLKRYEEAKSGPFPFAVGDIVTVRPGMNIRHPGRPRVVLEVNPGAVPIFTTEPGHPEFGMRPQVRIAFLATPDDMMVFWCEAAQLEMWSPDMVEPESRD